MGPAGEIIRLSLWDALTDIEDHPVLDEATREHVLRVMTSEGVGKQPWAILLEEQSTHTDRMNKGELEAQPGHRQQASSNQEERPTAKHTKTAENAECYDADGKRKVEVQACAPEQRPGKLKHSIENQPAYSKGENAEIKSSGRTQTLQPEGGDTPGSSIQNSTSASSPQKKALSTSTAVQEGLHKAKLKTQTNRKTETVFDSKTQSRKAGGGDDAESTQIRKVKKKGEVDQHVRGVIENKHVEKKTGQTNRDTESEDTIYTADPSPGPILKTKKTASVTEKPEVTTSQPKKTFTQPKETSTQPKETSTQPKETSTQPKKFTDSRSQLKDYKSQSNESRSQSNESRSQTPESRSQSKESRSQTPESRSQTPESRSQTPESRRQSNESRRQSKESRRQSKESRSQTKDSRSQARDPKSQIKEFRSQPNNAIKIKKKSKGQAAFVVGKPRQSQAEREADIPERPKRTAVNTEENDPEHQAEQDYCCSAHGPSAAIDQASVYRDDRTAAGSPRTLSSAALSNRSHGSALASSRPHSCAAASTRTHGSAAASNRTQGSAAPTRTDSPAAYSYRTHSAAATSTRTHSSSSFSYRTHSPTAVSTTTHSSSAMHTARERPWRTNKATKTEACSPAPLSLTQMPSQSAAPTHHSPSNPAKPGSNGHAKSPDEAAVLRERKAAAKAEKAERRRLEVERKRKEKEEELRREEEREEREERMRLELEEEQRHRAEQARLKKLKEEEDRQRQEEREMERQKRERAEMERERRRQEEKRRLLERLQKERQEEEKRRAAELKQRQQEQEAERERERIRLQEMDESERMEYLRRKAEDEEEKRRVEERRRRVDEEALLQAEEETRLLAELFERQRAALEQQLNFSRSLFVETEGLEQMQDISRPWVFSYFSLMKLLGLVEPPEELVEEVL